MFGFIKKSLNKTVEAIKTVAPKKKVYFTKDELEDILLEADVSYDLVEIILNEIYQEKITRDILEQKLLATLAYTSYQEPEYTPPFVELIVGVNGAGKTTTISKLAYKYKQEGKKVLLGAGDTFRAAAIEQLTLWANKLDIPIVSSKQGHDSSAVAYDAIDSAKSKGIDNVIIDTAGRLHTQTNLANELKKINRICGKAHEGAPHRTILIIDGTQGNSAISQAKAFNEMIGVDGIIITKLDGTAKGGSIFSIAYALELPILYVGTGEQPEDLTPFDKYEFVDGLLDALFEVQEEEKTVSQKDNSDTVNEKQTEQIDSNDNETSNEIVENVNDEKEESLQQFLKDEKLVLLKRISDTKVLVNYANTPVDTELEFKNGKWNYL
jgi:fused signal recognition particle receptor